MQNLEEMAAARDNKGKIVFLSTFVMLIFILLSLQSIQHFRESNKMREKDERAEQQLDLALSLFKTDGDFFAYELNNSEFYRSGQSRFLSRHDSIMTRLKGLYEIFDEDEAKDENIEEYLGTYDSTFKDIVAKIKTRGYRDYGLEGTMRAKAHEIERQKLLPEVDYLRLRRHEKDYLLRADSNYILKFDSLVARTSGPSKAILADYQKAFHDLADLSDLIGLESQTKLKGTLDYNSNQLLAAIKRRDVAVDQSIYEIHRNGIILFIIGMIGSTIVCFGLIVIILKRP